MVPHVLQSQCLVLRVIRVTGQSAFAEHFLIASIGLDHLIRFAVSTHCAADRLEPCGSGSVVCPWWQMGIDVVVRIAGS